MKLALIVNTYPSFVAQIFQYIFVHDRTRHYAAQGHDVRVYARKHPLFPSQEEYEGVVIYRGTLSECKEQISAWQPNCILVHAPHTWSLFLAIQLTFPKIAWIHGHETLWLLKSHYFPSWYLPLYAYDLFKFSLLKRFLEQCTSVVYISEWVKKESQKLAGVHSNSHVIHNPVDGERFHPLLDQRRPFPPQGISLRSFTNPRYGLDIAIRAYSQFSDSTLRLVGRGKLEPQFRALVEKLRASIIIDTMPYPDLELPLLYNQHHYFVAPSRGETQGVAMCEAMACGLPVVATKAGAIPEFVRDGQDGYLVPLDDPHALRNAILSLISDRRKMETMGENARQQILAKCESKRVIAQELQVIQHCE